MYKQHYRPAWQGKHVLLQRAQQHSLVLAHDYRPASWSAANLGDDLRFQAGRLMAPTSLLLLTTTVPVKLIFPCGPKNRQVENQGVPPSSGRDPMQRQMSSFALT